MRIPLIIVAAAGLVLVASVLVLGIGGDVKGEARLDLDTGASLLQRDEGRRQIVLNVVGSEGPELVREVVVHDGGLENVRTVLPETGRPVMVGQVTDDSLEPVAGVEIHCEFQVGSLAVDLGDLRTCELGYFFCDLTPLKDLGPQEIARGKVVAKGVKQGWTFTTTEAELLDMLEDARDEDHEGERRLALMDLAELRWMDSADPLALDENSLDCDMYMDALPGRRVRGQVVDDAGVGVADAVVWLSTEHGQSEFELKTEVDGTFEFGLWGEEEESWGNTLRLHGIHPSFGQSPAVAIPPNEALVELRLKNHGALLGYVISKHGEQTSGLEIWVESVGEQHGLPSGYCATSVGFDGSFSFRGLLPGRWILHVAGEEYGPFETGNHRIQIETKRKLLRVNIRAPGHVDLSLVSLKAWPVGMEGAHFSPSWGAWYSNGDFVRVGPNQWLLQLEEEGDLGITATIDWGDSFPFSNESWRGETRWVEGLADSVELKLEQRGVGSLQVALSLPDGSSVNLHEWAAYIWSASNGEAICKMNPGDVEQIPSGSYVVKLIPNQELPFDVQFMEVEVLSGQQHVLRFQPLGTGGRVSIYVDGMTREQLVAGLAVQLFHGDDQKPTPTIWHWSSGCVGGTSKYLYDESWNTSERLLAPGLWRAEFTVADEQVKELKFEIVDGQDVSLTASLRN